MARGHTVGKAGAKHLQTDPVYGTLDREAVDAGALTGEYVLMERVVVAMAGGRPVESIDRRYMPKDAVARREAQGWKVVSATVVPAPAAPKVKKKFEV